MGIEKKQDRRVLKTKRSIRNAFINLLAEKDLEKITIKEIADGADVDRKTVYNYYSSVTAILNELENEFFATIEKALNEFDFNKQKGMEFFDALAKLVEENLEFYELLMKIDSASRLSAKLVAYIKEKISFIIGWPQHRSRERIDMVSEFVTAGIIAAYNHWFHTNRTQSLRDFSHEMGLFILGGMSKYFFEI